MSFLKIRRIKDRENILFKNDWLEFHPYFRKANICVDVAGYFDERPQLKFTLTTLLSFLALLISPFFGWVFALVAFSVFIFFPWGQFYINLPIKTGRDQCENPTYGFYFYGEGQKIPDQLWIRRGKKSTVIELPWYRIFYRKSVMMKDFTWETARRLQKYRFDEPEILEKTFTQIFDYTYTLKSGEVQRVKATITVEEMEWRPKWFMWTSVFAMVRRSIDISFNDQIGERSGSWKGGVLGCSYEMLKGETPEETLRRMEMFRKFN